MMQEVVKRWVKTGGKIRKAKRGLGAAFCLHVRLMWIYTATGNRTFLMSCRWGTGGVDHASAIL